MMDHAADAATGEEIAVRNLLQGLMDGWNREDADAFARVFASDATFVAFDGTTLRGRAHIAEFHWPLFRTYLKGMRLSGRVDDVRFVTPEVAIMTAVGTTTLPGRSSPSLDRDSVQTLVAVRRDGLWSLASFQNTRHRPIGPGMSFLAWVIADAAWRWIAPSHSEFHTSKTSG